MITDQLHVNCQLLYTSILHESSMVSGQHDSSTVFDPARLFDIWPAQLFLISRLSSTTRQRALSYTHSFFVYLERHPTFDSVFEDC
jgi:hypothetical protein